MIKYTTSNLSDLIDAKKTPESEKKRIIATIEALRLIHNAIDSEHIECQLSEEMDNLQGYVDKILAAIE